MNLAHPVLASLLAAAALAGAGAAHAATPEDDGAAVARELVRHRTGFGDQAVTVTMELRNAGGEAARKEIRVKTLERQGDAPATVVILEAPSDVKGTALLSLGDDQWLYLPASHRVRRIASSNRSGPFLGSEFSYEDLMGDKPDRYRWRLTGKKACPAGGDCLVVETTPTYEGSGYSRRVLWVEAGTYRVMQVDYFDVKGDALKTLVYAGYQTYAGGHDRARTLTMTNHVTGKSTVLRFGDYAFGNGFTEADFNKERLAQARAELAAVVGLALAGAGAGGCGFTTAAGGHAAAEARVYPAGPRYAEQSHGNGVSVVLEPEVTATSEGGDHRLTLRPFYRVDPVDTGRTHWDLRRADWVGTFGAWELGAGVNVFRWGVLESVPLADAMNPADTIEDLRGTEKLGTPYLEVGWFGGAWAVRAYALPALGLFGGARFVDRGSRLRFGPAIDDAHPIYESALGAWNPSFALRITGTEGDLDVGIGLFSGTSRDPRFVAQLTSDALVPAYDIAHQASLDMQFTAGEVVLKLEAMGRLWSSELHPILSLGLGAEYDLWDVFGSGADLVLALEWLYDRRTVAAPVYVFENDVFVGFRLAFNDSGGTVVKAGVITDLGDGRSYLRGEASRRLGEQLRLALVAHAFVGSEGSRESGVLDDDYVEATLGWYF